MQSRYLILLALGLVALVLLPFLGSERSDTLHWHTETSEALEAAERQGQEVITFLYTDWCGYCKQMDQTTFQSPKVISELGSDYVWLRLNAEKASDGIEMQRRFRVSGFPTILLLDSEGRELDRLQGYMPPDRFVDSVRQSLESPDSLKNRQLSARSAPQDATAQFRLGEAYLQRRRYESAGEQFEKVLELDPTNESGHTPASLFYLAEARLSQPDRENPLEPINRLQEEFPESRYTQDSELMRADYLLSTGRHEEARQVLARFLENHPTHRAAPQIEQVLDQISG